MEELIVDQRCRSAGLTDVGRKRKVNQDAFLLDDDIGLYVVADGMGGHAAGEVASQEAVETVFGMVKRGLGTIPEIREELTEERARAACRMMEGAIQAATYMLFALAELDKQMSGMGTTISALLVLYDYAVSAQVGDSRIYRIRDFQSEQITEDHTLVAWQMAQGLITEEEAKRSPHRNVITRAVGNKDYVQVDTGIVDIKTADKYLLCSDGLHGYLTDEEIPLVIDGSNEDAVHNLIELANRRGGRDNITAVLVEII
jgi:serine/threonine protein phosphatase PrpC